MIDWWNFLYNALWIVALAIALSAVSWAAWQASARSTSLRTELSESGAQRTLMLAGALFSLGLALTAGTWPERIVWFIFTAVFIYRLIKPTKEPSTTP